MVLPQLHFTSIFLNSVRHYNRQKLIKLNVSLNGTHCCGLVQFQWQLIHGAAAAPHHLQRCLTYYFVNLRH